MASRSLLPLRRARYLLAQLSYFSFQRSNVRHRRHVGPVRYSKSWEHAAQKIWQRAPKKIQRLLSFSGTYCFSHLPSNAPIGVICTARRTKGQLKTYLCLPCAKAQRHLTARAKDECCTSQRALLLVNESTPRFESECTDVIP